VVHLHGAYLFNLLPAFALIARQVPYVVLPLSDGDLHFEARSSRLWLADYLRRLVVRGAAMVYCLSPVVEAQVQRLGLGHDRSVKLGNCVDVDEYRPSGPPLSGGPTILFIGSIGQRKRPLVVLEALSALRAKTHPTARAVFVGPYESHLYEHTFEAQLDRLGLVDHVTVTGYTTSVASYLEGASVLVLASSQEGLPGAMVEAMAAGVPIVATDVGAMGDVIRQSGCGVVTTARVGGRRSRSAAAAPA